MRGRVDRCQSLGCAVASPASVRKDKDESERTAKLDTAVHCSSGKIDCAICLILPCRELLEMSGGGRSSAIG